MTLQNLSLLGGLLLCLSACTGDKDTGPTNTEADTDTDTDADTDTDTDADTDADTDTDTDPQTELDCDDGIDNDADGLTDCADDECTGDDACVEACGDGIDNDADGLVDCEDDDCPCYESDCDDGTDNDLDGLVDCEDDECLDFCIEICDDKLDNDLDGLLDCEDDECLGTTQCPGEYTMELTWGRDFYFAMASGDLSYFRVSDAAITAAYGYPTVTATPYGWTGTPFTCRGYMYGLSHAIYGGHTPRLMSYYGAGGKGEPDFIFGFQPSTTSGSLTWYGTGGTACPITDLPYARLGFTSRSSDVYREDSSGNWYAQYSAGYTYGYFNREYGFAVENWGRITQAYPVTWIGEYGF